MRNKIRQRIGNALDAVGDAEYLAYRYDDSFPYNELYQSRVSGAMNEIVQLSDMPFEKSWVSDKLRMEVAENLLQYPADRLFSMKETIWGLFPRFCIKWPDFLETLDVTIYSYGQKIIQCSILDTWTDDNWKSRTKADDGTKEYLYKANLMALHIIEALQDIVDIGSFDARDSHTGKSLLNNGQRITVSAPLDDKIFEVLPALYDILVSNSVILSTITKADFIGRVPMGNVWAMVGTKAKAKMKAFVRQLKPYFDANWYNAVCASAGMTTDQMGKFNSYDALTEFERKVKAELKRIAPK